MSEEYIANFEAKMANLNNIKQQIEENLNAKKNFTETDVKYLIDYYEIAPDRNIQE